MKTPRWWRMPAANEAPPRGTPSTMTVQHRCPVYLGELWPFNTIWRKALDTVLVWV